MADRRHANSNWNVTDELGGLYHDIKEGVFLAVLMDIRAELRQLNSLLRCTEFTAIPRVLKEIRRNTTRKKRTK